MVIAAGLVYGLLFPLLVCLWLCVVVGVKLLSCLPCGLIADCGAIRGDLRGFIGCSLVLVLVVGERAVLGLKMIA